MALWGTSEISQQLVTQAQPLKINSSPMNTPIMIVEQGRVRLVLAVDEICEQFAAFTDFLCDMTDGQVRFEPIEMALFECDGFQVMVPRVDIRAVELAAPDGDHALFDHVYFARTPDDFRWLPPAPTSRAPDGS